MIINQNVEELQTLGSDDFEQSQMQINVTAQSFELILSRLYSNPLAAVIREITTNAVEATMQANKLDTRKVCIQLPTLLNHDLIIRDFGIGLDKEAVEKFLNCLFSSSKSDSNQFMGGFGLGSKSPLALVDCYNLNSYKDGVMYAFTYLKEPGKPPSVIYQGSYESTKENGIEVVINLSNNTYVSQGNIISATRRNTQQQLLAFHDLYRIVDDVSLPYDEMEDLTESIIGVKPVLDLPNFAYYTYTNSDPVRTSWNRWGLNTFLVQVGNVVYPYSLDRSYFANFNKIFKLPSNNCGEICIKVPVGLLDIPMSRETINKTDANDTIIVEYIEKAVQDLTNHIQSSVLYKSKSFKEFINQYLSYTQSNSLFYISYNKLLMSTNKDDNKLLKDMKTLVDQKSLPTGITSNLTPVSFFNSLIGVLQDSGISIIGKSTAQDKTIKPSVLTSWLTDILNVDTKKILFVLLDSNFVPKNLTNRNLCDVLMKHYADELLEENGHYSQVYVISDLKEYSEIYVILKTILESYNKSISVVEDPNVVDILEKLKADKNFTTIANSYTPVSGYFANTYLFTNSYIGDPPSSAYYVNKLEDANGKIIPLSDVYLSSKYPKCYVTTKSDYLENSNKLKTLINLESEYSFSSAIVLLKDFQVLVVPDNKYEQVLDDLKKSKHYTVYGKDDKIDINLTIKNIDYSLGDPVRDFFTSIRYLLMKPLFCHKTLSYSHTLNVYHQFSDNIFDIIVKILPSDYDELIDKLKALPDFKTSTLVDVNSFYSPSYTYRFHLDSFFENFIIELANYKDFRNTVISTLGTSEDVTIFGERYITVDSKTDKRISNPILEYLGI